MGEKGGDGGEVVGAAGFGRIEARGGKEGFAQALGDQREEQWGFSGVGAAGDGLQEELVQKGSLGFCPGGFGGGHAGRLSLRSVSGRGVVAFGDWGLVSGRGV